MNETATPIRILLVDDQDLFRAGLRMILESDPDLRVVKEATDGIDALNAVRDSNPDVVLMDIRMPKLDGIEATKRIVLGLGENAPRVLVLTTLETLDASQQALAAGADGFMLKNTDPEFLIAAIKALVKGKRIIAVNQLPELQTPAAPPAEYARLTERERAVFGALGHGLNNREIAQELFLSEATVKTHLTSILQKLNLRDRVQVVVYAYTHGLVD